MPRSRLSGRNTTGDKSLSCEHNQWASRYLRAAGLRVTQQRLDLMHNLFVHGNRHVDAETIYAEMQKIGQIISLATVYNTLHRLTEAGILCRVNSGDSKAYFDTNITKHHHFYHPDSGDLKDIPAGGVVVSCLSHPPEGYEIDAIDVIVRLRRSSTPSD